jgi:hypothetical protein
MPRHRMTGSHVTRTPQVTGTVEAYGAGAGCQRAPVPALPPQERHRPP